MAKRGVGHRGRDGGEVGRLGGRTERNAALIARASLRLLSRARLGAQSRRRTASSFVLFTVYAMRATSKSKNDDAKYVLTAAESDGRGV